jgi:hypothetical protein
MKNTITFDKGCADWIIRSVLKAHEDKDGYLKIGKKFLRTVSGQKVLRENFAGMVKTADGPAAVSSKDICDLIALADMLEGAK